MEIINHPFCNQVIGAPADMKPGNGIDPGTCGNLPVYGYRNDEGQWSASFWRPSEEEIQQLTLGGYIVLNVRASGRQHPVIAMGIEGYHPDAKVEN